MATTELVGGVDGGDGNVAFGAHLPHLLSRQVSEAPYRSVIEEAIVHLEPDSDGIERQLSLVDEIPARNADAEYPVARPLTEADLGAMHERRRSLLASACGLHRERIFDSDMVDAEMRALCELGEASEETRQRIMARRKERERVSMYMQFLAASVEETLPCEVAWAV